MLQLSMIGVSYLCGKTVTFIFGVNDMRHAWFLPRIPSENVSSHKEKDPLGLLLRLDTAVASKKQTIVKLQKGAKRTYLLK